MREFIHMLLIVLVLLPGCHNKPEDQGEDPPKGFDQQEKLHSHQQEYRESPVFYRYPSAREMLAYVRSKELSYKPGLVNPLNNRQTYHRSLSKNLNLGVYMTDLAYMILFQRTNKARDYFNRVVSLSQELRIVIPHKQKLVERVGQNLHEPDSLLRIFQDYQSEIIAYLMKTDQEDKLAVFSAGSYLEGLYLALQLVGDYADNQQTANKIAEQKYAFSHLEQFCRSHARDSNVARALTYLQEVNALFSRLPVEQDQSHSERTSAHQMVLKGGDRVIMNASHFYAMKQEVEKIRHQVVANTMNGAHDIQD
mgnify:CR=1 FL=1